MMGVQQHPDGFVSSATNHLLSCKCRFCGPMEQPLCVTWCLGFHTRFVADVRTSPDFSLPSLPQGSFLLLRAF